MNASIRNGQGFTAGILIGTLGGLIGLGGAKFRLPVLVLLVGLSLVFLSEAFFGMHGQGAPLFMQMYSKLAAGQIAGLGVGMFATVFRTVIGELLIPTLILMVMLGNILLVSAIKTSQQSH